MSPEMQIAVTFDLTETDALVLAKAIRAYGDARERAGIERAKEIAAENAVTQFGNMEGTDAYEFAYFEGAYVASCGIRDAIGGLIVPAPNAGGAKAESEVRE